MDERKECCWICDSDGIWRTGCGDAFLFEDGGPEENGASFCMYCGGKLDVRAAAAIGEQREDSNG